LPWSLVELPRRLVELPRRLAGLLRLVVGLPRLPIAAARLVVVMPLHHGVLDPVLAGVLGRLYSQVPGPAPRLVRRA
jgi:hypothetical protein